MQSAYWIQSDIQYPTSESHTMVHYSSDTSYTRIEYPSADPYSTYTMYNPADVHWDVLNDIMSSYNLHNYQILGLNGVAANFLRATASVDVISNAIMALVAPRQYDFGLAAIEQIKNGHHLDSSHPILDSWILVWSGFSVIVNRATPLHRDLGGALEDFDLLFSSGTHDACNLDVLDLGATLSYHPGTAVAIIGKVLEHGVKGREGGGEDLPGPVHERHHS